MDRRIRDLATSTAITVVISSIVGTLIAHWLNDHLDRAQRDPYSGRPIAHR